MRSRHLAIREAATHNRVCNAYSIRYRDKGLPAIFNKIESELGCIAHEPVLAKIVYSYARSAGDDLEVVPESPEASERIQQLAAADEVFDVDAVEEREEVRPTQATTPSPSKKGEQPMD